MAEMLGFWICTNCSKEHEVLSGGSTGCVSLCPQLSQWMSVLPQWVYQKPARLTEVQVPQSE